MEELSIKDLEKYLSRIYPDTSEEDLFFKLVEELGELAEVINIRLGRKSGQASNKDLANELADLLHYVIALAAVNGIDLEKTILEKDEQSAKKYQRDYNLTSFL